MDGLHAEEGLDLLLAGFVFEFVPPVFQPLDDRVAILRNFSAGHEGAVFWRDVGELSRVFNTAFDGLEVSLADAEDVVTHQPDGAIAIGNNAFQQLGIRQLTNQTLRGTQYHDPALDQFFRWQGLVAGTLKSDKFGDIFQVLSEYKLIALGNNRDIAHAELEQAFAAVRVIQNINGDEIDFFARKKLFRPETAASSRLGKQDELFVGAHVWPL